VGVDKDIERRCAFIAGRLRVELRGGLGNQLFTWASGLGIARSAGLPICLSESQLRGSVEELLKLGITAPFCRECKASDLWRRSTRLSKLKSLIQIGEVVEEMSFRFDPSLFRVSKLQTVRGYLQSWKYFEHVRSEIIRQASWVRQPSADFKRLRELVAEDSAIAVHVRGGDYRKHPTTFVDLDSTYYTRALDLVDKNWRTQTIIGFSDDVEFAQMKLPFVNNWIGPRDLPSSAETLILMSSARALVGANSTFSWWAGYLMCAAGSQTIFPKKWFFADYLTEEDLMPPDFTVI